MARYRKLPVVIDAEQWFPGKQIDAVDLLHGEGPHEAFIKTLEGAMQVSPSDWVITGVAGERYPCKDSIFRATYEPADEDA